MCTTSRTRRAPNSGLSDETRATRATRSGWLKESKHYYKRVEDECEGENGLSRRARNVKRTLKDRRRHFHHTLSKRIVAECTGRNVGRLMVGDLGGIRSEEAGSGRNWGRHGNKMLHG
ncbi:transposase [Halococcus hamelinensis]|uniref:transposase n=1 Tax=Halococcus hamelinensis TaxID=332168 RepID=UPI003083F55A